MLIKASGPPLRSISSRVSYKKNRSVCDILRVPNTRVSYKKNNSVNDILTTTIVSIETESTKYKSRKWVSGNSCLILPHLLPFDIFVSTGFHPLFALWYFPPFFALWYFQQWTLRWPCIATITNCLRKWVQMLRTFIWDPILVIRCFFYR